MSYILYYSMARIKAPLRPSKGFWGSGEQGHLFQGNRGIKSKFEGNRGTKTISGNREHRKQISDFWGTGEQTNLFRGTREQVPH